MTLNWRQALTTTFLGLILCSLIELLLHGSISITAVEISVAIGASRLVEWNKK